MTGDELLAKFATLVPPPRVHGMRYHGVFAPNAKERARVVPEQAATMAALEEAPVEAEPAQEDEGVDPIYEE